MESLHTLQQRENSNPTKNPEDCYDTDDDVTSLGDLAAFRLEDFFLGGWNDAKIVGFPENFIFELNCESKCISCVEYSCTSPRGGDTADRRSCRKNASDALAPFKDFEFATVDTSVNVDQEKDNSGLRAARYSVAIPSSISPSVRCNNDISDSDRFAFGLNTYLRGEKLGFGRQTSFKQLTSTPNQGMKVKSSVSLEQWKNTLPNNNNDNNNSTGSYLLPVGDIHTDGAGEDFRTWIDDFDCSRLCSQQRPCNSRIEKEGSISNSFEDYFSLEDLRREIDFLARDASDKLPTITSPTGVNITSTTLHSGSVPRAALRLAVKQINKPTSPSLNPSNNVCGDGSCHRRRELWNITIANDQKLTDPQSIGKISEENSKSKSPASEKIPRDQACSYTFDPANYWDDRWLRATAKQPPRDNHGVVEAEGKLETCGTALCGTIQEPTGVSAGLLHRGLRKESTDDPLPAIPLGASAQVQTPSASPSTLERKITSVIPSEKIISSKPVDLFTEPLSESKQFLRAKKSIFPEILVGTAAQSAGDNLPSPTASSRPSTTSSSIEGSWKKRSLAEILSPTYSAGEKPVFPPLGSSVSVSRGAHVVSKCVQTLQPRRADSSKGTLVSRSGENVQTDSVRCSIDDMVRIKTRPTLHSAALTNSTDVSMTLRSDNPPSGARDEKVDREVQRANEERKERIRMFMAQRRAEKQQQVAAAEHIVVTTSHDFNVKPESERGKDNCPPSSEPLLTTKLPESRSSRRVRPPNARERKRQSLPAAPYLPENVMQNSSGRGPSMRRNHVTSVVVRVGSGKSDTNVMVAVDRSAIEVRSATGEHLERFAVDECVDSLEDSVRLPSSILLEHKRRFHAGTNVAILLAATTDAQRSSFTVTKQVVETAVLRLPPSSEIFLSACVLRKGMVRDLLIHHKKMERTRFNFSPITGVSVDDVNYVKIVGLEQVSRLITTAYHDASVEDVGFNGLFVVLLVLKQVRGKDVVLSSLLLTDVGAHHLTYQFVLHRLDCVSHQLFGTALSGPTFTSTVFSIGSGEGGTISHILTTQQKLATVVNRHTRLGSLTRFVELARKQLEAEVGAKSSETNATLPPCDASRMREHLLSAIDILANPAEYRPGDTQRCICPKRRSLHPLETKPTGAGGPFTGKTTAAKDISRLRPDTVDGTTRFGAAQTLPELPAEQPVCTTGGLVDKTELSRPPVLVNQVEIPVAHTVRCSSWTTTLPCGSGIDADRFTSGTSTTEFPEVPLAKPPGDEGSSRLSCRSGPAHTFGNSLDSLASSHSRTNETKFLPGATAIGSHGGPSWPSSPVEEHSLTLGTPPVTDTTTSSVGSHEEPLTAPVRSTKVRTLVVVDPNYKETLKATYNNRVIIATGEDDFEEYAEDEVTESSPTAEVIHSRVLEELCDTLIAGCNAAILGAGNDSLRASPTVLKNVVHRIFAAVECGEKVIKGSLTVSITKLQTEMVVDLLDPRGKPQKLIVAISPIFGSCVHGVLHSPVSDAKSFDRILDNALVRSQDAGRGFIFCSIILKLKPKVGDDVLVCSLVSSMVGESVGLYRSVIDRSPLVPRALFHYALGGPCFTVALLDLGGEGRHVSLMLEVQKRLGEIHNRPTLPGSIVKFIHGVRHDLAPALQQKFEKSESLDDCFKSREILNRLKEMVQDAEALLEDFDHNEPKAYVHETAGLGRPKGALACQKESPVAQATLHSAEPGVALIKKSLPCVTLSKPSPQGKAATIAATNDEMAHRIRSLVYVDHSMCGENSVDVQGNSVLVSTSKGGRRFHSDEIVEHDGSDSAIPDSKLIDNLVTRFLDGHHCGLLAADSSNCAFTPLTLRKMVYHILASLSQRGNSSSGSTTISASSTPKQIGHPHLKNAELSVSMALIKNHNAVDLLPVEESSAATRFEVEHSALYGPLLTGVNNHVVSEPQDFDQFLAIAIDNADPELQTADPGIMAVVLRLAQYVPELGDGLGDIYVSTLLCTAVFDAVHHYTRVLQADPNEPLELFRYVIGGAVSTVAMVGVSDGDASPADLLQAIGALSQIQNKLVDQPNSINKHIQNLREVLMPLQEKAASEKTSTADWVHVHQCAQAVKRMLADAEALRKRLTPRKAV